MPILRRELQMARDIAIVQLREGLHPLHPGRHSWRQIAAKVGIRFQSVRERYVYLTVRPKNARIVRAIRNGRLG